MTNEKFADMVSTQFRRDWDKNDYTFSDGKSIETWIRKTIEDLLNGREMKITKIDIPHGKENYNKHRGRIR